MSDYYARYLGGLPRYLAPYYQAAIGSAPANTWSGQSWQRSCTSDPGLTCRSRTPPRSAACGPPGNVADACAASLRAKQAALQEVIVIPVFLAACVCAASAMGLLAAVTHS